MAVREHGPSDAVRARPRREVVVPLAAIGVKAVLQSEGEGDGGAVDVEHLAAEARLHRVPAGAGVGGLDWAAGRGRGRGPTPFGAAAHIDGPGESTQSRDFRWAGEMYWVISPPYRFDVPKP